MQPAPTTLPKWRSTTATMGSIAFLVCSRNQSPSALLNVSCLFFLSLSLSLSLYLPSSLYIYIFIFMSLSFCLSIYLFITALTFLFFSSVCCISYPSPWLIYLRMPLPSPFLSVFAWSGQSAVVGIAVFAFAYITTIPSWVNEKQPYVSCSSIECLVEWDNLYSSNYAYLWIYEYVYTSL